jgi:hypothetical protein
MFIATEFKKFPKLQRSGMLLRRIPAKDISLLWSFGLG